ncbi:MAG: response regulator [candidate division NC10 bacterium]|nr:response regulator [candidate division NC10 bacterium]MBI4391012.1 response regulator [candidate division NC10 bacterium]
MPHPFPGKQRSILVVDDERPVLALLSEYLASKGFNVLTARDGQSGLEKARAARPDLIVLDVMLPRLDGYAVARALKGDPATAPIPIIIFSTRSSAADRAAFQAAGADFHILKPFDPEQLLAKILELLPA